MIIKFIIKIQQKSPQQRQLFLYLRFWSVIKRSKKGLNLLIKTERLILNDISTCFLMGLKSSRGPYDLIASVRLRAVHTVGLRLRFFIASKGLYGIQCKHWGVQMVWLQLQFFIARNGLYKILCKCSDSVITTTTLTPRSCWASASASAWNSDIDVSVDAWQWV